MNIMRCNGIDVMYTDTLYMYNFNNCAFSLVLDPLSFKSPSIENVIFFLLFHFEQNRMAFDVHLLRKENVSLYSPKISL